MRSIQSTEVQFEHTPKPACADRSSSVLMHIGKISALAASLVSAKTLEVDRHSLQPKLLVKKEEYRLDTDPSLPCNIVTSNDALDRAARTHTKNNADLHTPKNTVRAKPQTRFFSASALRLWKRQKKPV